MFILAASLLLLTADSVKSVDPIAPIERYIDSTMNGYDDEYDRMMEKRHLREQNHRDGKVTPTYYESPWRQIPIEV